MFGAPSCSLPPGAARYGIPEVKNRHDKTACAKLRQSGAARGVCLANPPKTNAVESGA